MYDITHSEISQIINNLNSNKSSDFSPRVLKVYNSQLSDILSHLFNNCMNAGVFPVELKIAKVIPLYKAGNINLLSNYRPISILPVFSKIFEKLIHVRFANFFDNNKVLYQNQFGFRRSRSTCHALQTSVNSVIKSLNNKKCVTVPRGFNVPV